MDLRNEGVDFFAATDSLFNTTFIADYVGLTLDTGGHKELKHSIKNNESDSINVKDVIGVELDDFFGDDFDFEDDEKGIKENGIGD